jgi:ABC-type nitrate/sulfonate/bicarbonate transport system ATPase subunit
MPPLPSVAKSLIDLGCTVNFEVDLAKYPSELSGGEQQILVLLLGLLREPSFLVADEPLSAIDIGKQARLIELLASWFAGNRRSMLFVSHDIDEAVLLADRLIVLSAKDATRCLQLTIPKQRPRDFDWRYTPEFKDLTQAVRRAIL